MVQHALIPGLFPGLFPGPFADRFAEPFLGAVRAGDAAVVVVLILFAAWGAHRGALRQTLSLCVLLGAFFVAGRHGDILASTVGKLTSLAPGERGAASWIAVLFLCLVAGAILLRFVAARLPPRSEATGARVLGGALGLLKGAFVIIVLGYALIAATGAGSTAPPALSRTDGPEAAAEDGSVWARRLEDSLSAGYLAAGSGLLTRWLEVPAWVRDQMENVDRRLDSGALRRPRAP